MKTILKSTRSTSVSIKEHRYSMKSMGDYDSYLKKPETLGIRKHTAFGSTLSGTLDFRFYGDTVTRFKQIGTHSANIQ